jgi:hypothetical protein
MVSGNDKNSDGHETEAEIAVFLKIKIVIPGRPEGSRGEARAPVSIPSRTARVCPADPVSPVLSGRDQASAIPLIAIAPAHGYPCPGDYNANMAIAWLSMCQTQPRATGNRRTAGALIGTRGFIRSARLLPNSIEFQGRFANKSHARITFRARLAGRAQLSRLRRWPSLASPSRSPADAFRT